MQTFSALLAFCAGNSPVTSEFPSQRPVARSFDAFFDMDLKKWLSKQSWRWWFETPLRSSWRHCNDDTCARLDFFRIYLEALLEYVTFPFHVPLKRHPSVLFKPLKLILRHTKGPFHVSSSLWSLKNNENLQWQIKFFPKFAIHFINISPLYL